MGGVHGPAVEPADSGSAPGGLSESCLEVLISPQAGWEKSTAWCEDSLCTVRETDSYHIITTVGLPLLFPGIMRFTMTPMGFHLLATRVQSKFSELNPW